MLRKLVTAALVTASLAAPAATAAHVRHDCRMEAISYDGHSVTAVVYGYVESESPNESVTVWCYITINGSTVAVTNPMSSLQLSFSWGLPVVFEMAPEDDVRICHHWSASGGESGDQCRATSWSQFPPQEVLDVLDTVVLLLADVVTGFVDPLVCPMLASLSPGVPGVVDIGPDGDVTIPGPVRYDCPPYDAPEVDLPVIRVGTTVPG